jgi:hypothetical protein
VLFRLLFHFPIDVVEHAFSGPTAGVVGNTPPLRLRVVDDLRLDLVERYRVYALRMTPADNWQLFDMDAVRSPVCRLKLNSD